MHGSTCWREWLGTIRTEEVKASNLFLLGKMRAPAASSDDGCPFLSELYLNSTCRPSSRSTLPGATSRSLMSQTILGQPRTASFRRPCRAAHIGLFIGADTRSGIVSCQLPDGS
jgi:hypothetical protein